MSLGQIKNLVLPLPALAEQKRIAKILDKAEAIRRKRQQALDLADDFLRSLFLDMFGDPCRNPKGWPVAPLSRLAQIWSGSTPSRKDPANYGGQIPWVKTTEVNGREILDTEETVSEKGIASARLKLFPPGSILVALYGQGKTRGRCALLGIHAATNQACGVLMPSQNFEPLFQMAQLSLSYDRLRALGQGGNQPNLNLGLLGSFSVINPPLLLQQKFVSLVHIMRNITGRTTQAFNQAQSLFKCLQHRTFSGEI